MAQYRTFKRSCTDWQSFASARKYLDMFWNTAEQARTRCQEMNDNLSKAQIRRGTKYEFESI